MCTKSVKIKFLKPTPSVITTPNFHYKLNLFKFHTFLKLRLLIIIKVVVFSFNYFFLSFKNSLIDSNAFIWLLYKTGTIGIGLKIKFQLVIPSKFSSIFDSITSLKNKEACFVFDLTE
jgi:hypothetical protein